MKKVLVIDDAELILELIKLHMEKVNYLVDVCDDSEIALNILEKTNYDLILLDIEMPGKNGVEILKMIKAQAPVRHTPVIMLTAKDDPESIKECMDSGATDYILKPFNILAAMKRIEEVVKRGRLN